MERRDQGRVSLVDFLRSIRFRPNNTAPAEVDTHFAHLDHPRGRPARQPSAEDSSLVRSAN